MLNGPDNMLMRYKQENGGAEVNLWKNFKNFFLPFFWSFFEE